MRTIRVTGKGQLKVHPDMTRITIDLEGIYRDYADTLKESSRATEKMKKLLVPFGFETSDLKTLSFYQLKIFDMFPYIITVVVLILTSIVGKKENQPPASLGLSYFREER